MACVVRSELGALNLANEDASAKPGDGRQRIGLEANFTLVDDRHARAQLAHIFDDVGRENYDGALSELCQQVEESQTLRGVETSRRLVHNDELRRTEERDGDAEPRGHAARVAAEGLLPIAGEVGLLEQAVHHLASLALADDALEHREVVEQVLGADVLVEPELLGEISEDSTERRLVLEDVDLIKHHAARVWLLERGDDAHQRGLARAIGAEESEH